MLRNSAVAEKDRPLRAAWATAPVRVREATELSGAEDSGRRALVRCLL